MIRHGPPAVQPAQTVSRVMPVLVSDADGTSTITPQCWQTPPFSGQSCLKMAPAPVQKLQCTATTHIVQHSLKPKTP